MTSPLFEPITLGALKLKTRVTMAPMTRSRAVAGEAINPSAATYYAQRAGAGLIISEATQISRQGQGYPNTPGIFSEDQVAGWKVVTDAVHAAGGLMVAQLWHVGRVSLPDYQPDGGAPVGASAVAAEGQAMRPDFSMTPFVTPRELTEAEIEGVLADYAHAARQAKAAGFDGVELHGANGYLVDQFLRDGSNRRTDRWGGSVENRARFLVEATRALVEVWGPERVGVRLSPTGTNNGMFDSDPAGAFGHAARALKPFGLAFLHLIEAEPPHPMAGPEGSPRLAKDLREAFGGPVMLNGGLTRVSAEAALAEGRADLVSIGVPFLANPDLVDRWKVGAELNPADRATFYGGGDKGYIDYPTLKDAAKAA
ncbi:alkene reductase [Brevundimonas sp.]|jgi:N-ethylmaleimide reductase|uniref:alkene reductase n=1 Tax=Brevundimonas sp. TaxID=1871086 RepID=UPI002E13557E|nr:alkene reductase [Brevundimonas sp.]